MARPLRMESGVGVYHVLNRGNHRAANCWLAATMHMDNLHEVSRKVSAWTRQPDPSLQRNLS